MNKDNNIINLIFKILKNLKEDIFMFNFGERTIGEKIVMVGAGVLVIGNTVVNTVNTIRIRKTNKRVTEVENNVGCLSKRLTALETLKTPDPQEPPKNIA